MSESLSPLSLSDIKPKMQLKGVVKRVSLAGALVDVGVEGCDACCTSLRSEDAM